MIGFGRVDVNVDFDLERELANQVEPFWSEELAPTAEQLAKQGAPVDTGELRAKTFAGVVEIDGVPVMIAGSEAEHFRFVENGTKHMEPQPFVRPAAFAAVAQLFRFGG